MEIRSYANVIGEQFVAKWVPLVWEAFLDYRLNAVQLSRLEYEIIKALIEGSPEQAKAKVEKYGLLKARADGSVTPNRERNEIESKLRALGLTPPWNHKVPGCRLLHKITYVFELASIAKMEVRTSVRGFPMKCSMRLWKYIGLWVAKTLSPFGFSNIRGCFAHAIRGTNEPCFVSSESFSRRSFAYFADVEPFCSKTLSCGSDSQS